MAIANVELTDTYNGWRTRTNLVIDRLNALANTTGVDILTANNITGKNFVDAAGVFANNLIVRQNSTFSGNVNFANTGNVNFGAIATVRIPGGSVGQAIITNGASVLSFGVPTVNFSQLTGQIAGTQFPGALSISTGTFTIPSNTTFSSTVTLGSVSNVKISGGITGEFLKSLGGSTTTFANVQFADLQGTISGGQFSAIFTPLVGTWNQGANTIFTGSVTANNLVANSINTPNATGGDQGADTINAKTVYDDGLPLRGTPIALLEDQKTSGTAAGSSVTSSFVIRTLNTEVFDPYNLVAIISSNRFSLAPQTYIIKWSAPAMRAHQHQTYLYDATNSTEIKRGTSEYAESVSANENEPVDIQTRSVGMARVTVANTTIYQIRHFTTRLESTDGLGSAVSNGTEVYAQVEIYAG